jgi:hypothetical protein
MSPSELTLEEEAIAFAAAHPAGFFGVQKRGLGGPELKLVSPTCGVALLDLYFCAALQGMLARADAHEPSEKFAEPHIVRDAWEVALEAVRQRPRPTPRGDNGARPTFVR